MRAVRRRVVVLAVAGLLVVTTGAVTGSAAASATAGRPVIARLALGRSELGAGGGATVLHLEVRNGSTCWFRAPSAVRVNRSRRPCGGGLDLTVVRLARADADTTRTWRITGWVRGADGLTAHRSVVLRQVGLKPLSVTLSSPTALVIDRPYGARLVVHGGRAPYRLAVSSGSLPSGVSLSPAGALAGTPTTVGIFKANLLVTDASRPRPLRTTVTLTVPVLPPAPSISTTSLPPATQHQPYQVMLAATGGVAPYAWSVVAGSLPAGLGLEASGLLTGTPASSGTFALTVEATDVGSPAQSATVQLTLVVTAASFAVTSLPVATATLDTSFTTTLVATGGVAPYTWSVASGRLPSGLTLSGSGVLSGTPTTTGSYPVTLAVTDTSTPPRSTTFELTVNVAAATMPLAITTPTTLTGTAQASQPFSYQLVATGGVAPYTWLLTGGNLPAGLTLSQTGLLSGTPAPGSAGIYLFTVEAVDSAVPADTAKATISLNVGP